jgi:small subunit ribosomal protein S8
MDTIGDFLTRIRNAILRRKPSVRDIYSNLKMAIAKVLKEEGYIGKISVIKEQEKKFIEIELKYDDSGSPLLHSLKRISKPGRRIYVKYKEIPKVKPLAGYKEELGIVIISTPRGVMTGEEARKRHLGGELIAEIY